VYQREKKNEEAQKLRISATLIFFLFFFTTLLYAFETEEYFSTSSGYNSNVMLMSGVESKIADIEVESFFIDSDSSAFLMFSDKLFFEYTLSSSYAFDENILLSLDNSTEVTFEKEYGFFDTSFSAFFNVSLGDDNYSDGKISLSGKYVNGGASADFFLYSSEQALYYILASLSFYKSLEDVFSYINGPSFMLELGEYYYYGEKKRGYIYAAAGINSLFFDDFKYSEEITLSSSYLRPNGKIGIKYPLGPVSLFFSANYSYTYYLYKDFMMDESGGNMEEGSSRKTDHTISVVNETTYTFLKRFELGLTLSYLRNFSNSELIYSDSLSYERFISALKLSCMF